MRSLTKPDDTNGRSRQSQANAERLHDETRSLRTQYSGVLGGVNFKEFREHSKAVTEMFKTLKLLHPSDREGCGRRSPKPATSKTPTLES